MEKRQGAPTPEQVFAEYEQGVRYKCRLGTRGLYDQARVNERFYVGDQWHGAHCGGERPLVRYNIIKRIGEYKQAVVGASPVAVNYSADGVPDTQPVRDEVEQTRRAIGHGTAPQMAVEALSDDARTQLVMSALSDYFRTTAERVDFEGLRDRALQNAYTTGTGVLYTYWDERIPTGQVAADGRTPIRGDIACEVLDVEQVYFGDPTVETVQEQPYILVAQRRRVEELRRLARRFGADREALQRIRPDRDHDGAATPEGEPDDKATLLTRFWKAWNEDGTRYEVMAEQVCRGVTVRPPWRLGVRLYPLAVFRWETRRGCAYGESEIPYLIPNQIAINRAMTAGVWASMVMGMPIMVVNGDVVTQPITNDPGQVLQVFGSSEDVERAVHYVTPPALDAAFGSGVTHLIDNTLAQAGVNSAMLGDVQPDNTSAIIAVREAALMPLNMVRNRFYRFIEEVARQWAEFFVCHYGRRALKVDAGEGVWYMPFDGARFTDRLIRARVDVGAASAFGEAQSIETLGNLFDRGVIDAVQYLSRLPKGTVPHLDSLIRERKMAAVPPQAE